MPTALLLEGKIAGEWQPLAAQKLGMPPGTISDHRPDGIRDVYITQVFAEHATISRLPFGIDVEQGRDRIINEDDLREAEVIARIGIGESHEMTLKPGRAPEAMPIRYRCVRLP